MVLGVRCHTESCLMSTDRSSFYFPHKHSRGRGLPVFERLCTSCKCDTLPCSDADSLAVTEQQRGGVPQRYPVVVYLHGGEFKYGGKDFYKPDILLKQNVILVVPNYRLGILGKSFGSCGLHDSIINERRLIFSLRSLLPPTSRQASWAPMTFTSLATLASVTRSKLSGGSALRSMPSAGIRTPSPSLVTMPVRSLCP